MRIFLLGSGYIGQALIPALAPHELWASTTTPEKLGQLPVDKAFLFSPEALALAIDQCDCIVMTVAPIGSASYEDTYLRTALLLQDLIEKSGRHPQVIYTSSTSVYGDQQGRLVNENTPLHPRDHKAQVLIDTEAALLAINTPVCILRLGGIYGPGRSLEERAIRMSGKHMPGSGLVPTNHTHQSDAVQAIAFAIENHLTGIYNVVGDDHPTKSELYGRLCLQINLPPPSWTETGDTPYFTNAFIDNRKIKSSGFTFSHPTTSQKSP